MHTGDATPALARLAHYLIAKSIIEAILVGALAVSFYFTAFAPYLRGSVDEANRQRVSGWAVNQAAPQQRIEVLLYIDGRFIASRKADLPRPDVKIAGSADEWHGFSFDTPPLNRGEHEARVYAICESDDEKRRTLQVVGQPVRFSVEISANENPPQTSTRRGLK